MLKIPRFFLVIATCAVLVPSAAFAVSFESDFSDFEADWLLESGSEVSQTPAPLTLSAAAVSPKERGRIMMRKVLSGDVSEILNAIFTIEASELTAPLAARVFYYDADRKFIDSDHLFGTHTAGTFEISGSILTPEIETAGFRIRLYSNAPEGSVTLANVKIESSIIPTPEPGTAVLMGLGLSGLAVGGSRKRA